MSSWKVQDGTPPLVPHPLHLTFQYYVACRVIWVIQ